MLFFFARITAPIVKGDDYMITFIMLVMAIALCAIVAVIALMAGGTAVLVVYGDVIVCVLIIVWITKKIINKRKR